MQNARDARRSATRNAPSSPSRPLPPASTPTIWTLSLSSRNGWNSPMAFEPPPTAATSSVRQTALGRHHLFTGLFADDGLEIPHQWPGTGAGPQRCADADKTCLRTLVTQSRRASFMASFNVPRAGMRRATTSAHREASSGTRWAPDAPRPARPYRPCRDQAEPAQPTVAEATPCCPAPVSAINRVLPMRSRQQRSGPRHVVDLVRCPCGSAHHA